ncbi:uncharacterized protein LOC131007596 [Salvia miltiorrhiza]|uniref:uncharacterized protein LOC131007596 n=1 Tax=Salvia miltiorrhiza TaxID=226208 RepID=UPI0025AD03E3|nr:uncharacterized protein LOC131007596 [Salvia miltiorrhiza]
MMMMMMMMMSCPSKKIMIIRVILITTMLIRMANRGRSGAAVSRMTEPPHSSSSDGGDISASVGDLSLGGGEAGSSSETSLSRAGMKELTIVKGILCPSHDVSHLITESFQRVINHHGFCWKLVSDEQKKEYFKDFKKFFYWTGLSEEVVYKHCYTRARDRYRHLIHKIKRCRNNEQQPPFIPERDWSSWKEYWGRDDVKAKAEKTRRNRISEPYGVGTGIIKHRGGSICALDYAMEMMKVNERIETLSQLVPGTNKVPEVDRNEIFKSLIQPSKKKRLFGAGSLAHCYISGSSSADSAATSQLDSTAQQKLVEVQELLELERQEHHQSEEKMRAKLRARDEAQAKM